MINNLFKDQLNTSNDLQNQETIFPSITRGKLEKNVYKEDAESFK